VTNVIAKRKDVAVTGCASVPGGWEASGTVTNPAKGPTKYLITIFFITSQATVEASGMTTLDVPAHESANWRVSSDFAVSDPDTTCVLRGVG